MENEKIIAKKILHMKMLSLVEWYAPAHVSHVKSSMVSCCHDNT